MPADPIAVGNVVQVVIGTKFAGQQALNVLYFQSDSAMGPNQYIETLEALIGEINSDGIDGIVPFMLPAMGPNVTHNFTQAQRVYPVRSIPVRIETASDGTHVDDCDTFNIAAVISKKVDKPGRGRTGSFHLAGIPNTAYFEGSFTPPYIDLLDALADRLETYQEGIVAGSKWFPVTFNPNLGAGENVQQVVQCSPRGTVRVMRRRTVGVGI